MERLNLEKKDNYNIMGQYFSSEDFTSVYLVEDYMCERSPYSKKFRTTEWDYIDSKNHNYWFNTNRFTVIPKNFYQQEEYIL